MHAFSFVLVPLAIVAAWALAHDRNRRYVGGKDGLLDAIVDHVYGQIELPPRDEPDWWAGLTTIMRSARTVLLAHRAAAGLVITRPETGPNALRVLDRILGFLDRAGLGPGEAVQVGQAFTRSTLSLVALEATMLPGLGPPGKPSSPPAPAVKSRPCPARSSTTSRQRRRTWPARMSLAAASR